MKLIAILNPKQALMYMKHGCDCVSVKYENGNMVFYFNREETKPFFTKWINYELN